jgi:hypothetical protein
MSWQVTGKQKFPAVIGEPFGGGFFAGYISHTADGNPTHALIVAPRAIGATGTGYTLTTMLAWKTATTTTAGTTSTFDGAANTAAMVTAGIADHPAANFCVGLNIGGFTDWYLPSRLELDIAYFNLKPTTTLNATTGIANSYAVPLRSSAFIPGFPIQTQLTAFASGGAEAFAASVHWSSTEVSSTRGFNVSLASFQQDNGSGSTKTSTGDGRVRAFRRITL